MRLKIYLFVVVMNWFIGLNAQVRSVRLSFELNAGIPVGFSSIPPGLSTYGGAGLRYNITSALSAQVAFNIGVLRGNQNVKSSLVTEMPKDYIKYRNSFYQYTFRGQLNLERVFKLRRYLKNINPYLTGGVGYTHSMDIRAERIDGRMRRYNGVSFWTVQYGAMIRYYLNPTLDLNIGTELNTTETYFMDGIPMDERYDNFLMTYVGISIKIGSKKKNQHIEWNNSYRRKKIIPGKPKYRPEDENKDVELIVEEPTPPQTDSVIAAEKETAASDSLALNNIPEKTQPDEAIVTSKPQSQFEEVSSPQASSVIPSPVSNALSKATFGTGILSAGGSTPTVSRSKLSDPGSRINIKKTAGTAMGKTHIATNAGGPVSQTKVAQGKPASSPADVKPASAPRVVAQSKMQMTAGGSPRVKPKNNVYGKTVTGSVASTGPEATQSLSGAIAGKTPIAAAEGNVSPKAKNNIASAGIPANSKPGSNSAVTGKPTGTGYPKVVQGTLPGTTSRNIIAAGYNTVMNTAKDPSAPTLNFIEGVKKPPATYNIVVGAFRKSGNAYALRNRLRKQGFQSAIFRSDIDSQIMRVCIYSTSNKEVALKQLERARIEIQKEAWIHIFNP